MAGNKPGPAKGQGGRPRKKGGSRLTKGKNKGYIKVTVGPKGKGKQQYKHRVVAGAKEGEVVMHLDDNKSNVSKANLRRASRAENTADRNRDMARRAKRRKKRR